MTERYEMALQAIIEICRKEDPMSKDAAVIVKIAEMALGKGDYIEQTDMHGNTTWHRSTP